MTSRAVELTLIVRTRLNVVVPLRRRKISRERRPRVDSATSPRALPTSAVTFWLCVPESVRRAGAPLAPDVVPARTRLWSSIVPDGPIDVPATAIASLANGAIAASPRSTPVLDRTLPSTGFRRTSCDAVPGGWARLEVTSAATWPRAVAAAGPLPAPGTTAGGDHGGSATATDAPAPAMRAAHRAARAMRDGAISR